MARSQEPHEWPVAHETARPHLTRVPHTGAIRITLSADDPAQPDTIRGCLAIERHGALLTVMIEGRHGQQILHLDATALSLGDGLARIGAALAATSLEAAYPVPGPTAHPEVVTRQSRGYGS